MFFYKNFESNTPIVNQQSGMDKNPPGAEIYFLQQHGLCKKFLRAYVRKKDAEDLHQLRVAIKRVKAILAMLHELQAGFDFENNFKPYKNIFRQAGHIREELLHNNRIFSDARNRRVKTNHSRLLIKLNKELALSVSKELESIRDVLPTIQLSIHQLERGKIFPYCQKMFKQLEKKWKKADNKAGLHKFRKQLKQFLYCAHLLTEEERKELLSDKKHKHLDYLQDTIGQWHDNVLLLKKIKKDDLKVDKQFLETLKDETKNLMKAVRKSGDKL